MSVELQAARKHSQNAFDPKPLQDIIYKHTIPRARLDEIVKQMEQVPLLNRRTLFLELSREDQFRYAYKVTAKMIELKNKYGWTEEELSFASSPVFGQYLPNRLHSSAFMYVIQVIGSDEQARKWIPLCQTYQMIGCYAQTELGHGSNLQKLQTKAYFDPATKDLALFSNDRISSRKWWIGGLGITSDHAAVQALLYFPPKDDPNCTDKSKYTNLGPHLFIVPIRNPKTRVPLPGVTVGDIGPKAANGFSIIDNGYLVLNNVRIPADNLLNRFTKIDTSGPVSKYVLNGNPRVMYASMTNLRAGYPLSVGIPLAKAVTIASRYLTIRRQFQQAVQKGDGKGEKPVMSEQEVQVIKYSSVYMRLVPFIALAYSMGFVNDAIQQKFNSMMTELVETGKDNLLPEVHSLTSALKGVVSMQGTRAIEQCQILMGGHGFMYNSGLSTLYGNALPSQTFEGENYVVAQQTASALVKVVDIILAKGKDFAHANAFPAAQFLINTIDNFGTHKNGTSTGESSPKTTKEWLQDDEYLIHLLEARTTVLLLEYKNALNSRPANEIKHLSANVGFAFGEQFLVTEFLRGSLSKIPANGNSTSSTQQISLSMARVLALQHILDNIGTLVEHSQVQGYSIGPLRAALEQEIVKLAPHVVALTDAFGFTDYELNTTLGNKDGEPYAHLVEASKKSSLNHVDFSTEIREIKKAGLGGFAAKI